MRRMKPAGIAACRLTHQHITESKLRTPENLLERVCGIQAQEYESSLWAMGVRLPGSSSADMERAVALGKIVRTWPMRGTLHFVSAKDVRWLLALLAPRIIAANATRYRQLGLDSATLLKAVGVMEKILTGGKQLTRHEIALRLNRSGIKTDGQRLAYMLQRAGLDRVLCFGPRRDKQFTYTLLEEWTPSRKIPDREQSLAMLAGRYFTSRGPAAIDDFIWWSGLTASDARRGLEAANPPLVLLAVKGKSYWMANDTPETLSAERRIVLLPAFDEYIVGYKDRSIMLGNRHRAEVISMNGVFRPVIVLDGRVVGTWKRTVKGSRVIVEPAPFGAGKKSHQSLIQSAAEEYANFLEKLLILK